MIPGNVVALGLVVTMVASIVVGILIGVVLVHSERDLP